MRILLTTARSPAPRQRREEAVPWNAPRSWKDDRVRAKRSARSSMRSSAPIEDHDRIMDCKILPRYCITASSRSIVPFVVHLDMRLFLFYSPAGQGNLTNELRSAHLEPMGSSHSGSRCAVCLDDITKSIARDPSIGL